MSRIINR